MNRAMPAKDYYGKGAAGWVVLLNNKPRHFTGPNARAEALALLLPEPECATKSTAETVDGS